MRNFILNFLTKPFRTELPIFLLLWAIFPIPSLYYYFQFGSYVYSIYIILYALVCAYVVLLFIGHDGFVWRVVKTSFLLFLMILNFVRLMGMSMFGKRYPGDALAAFFQTNGSETMEFLNTYLIGDIVLLVAVLSSVLICAFVLWLFVWHLRLSLQQKFIIPFVAILIISCLAVAHNPIVITDRSVNADILNAMDNSADLRKHLCHPKLSQSDKNYPRNVILILGESFSKYHSSLYGYHIPTNPKLEQLKKDGSLFCYNEVQSPATSTAESFRYMLNTLQRGDGGDNKWYNTPNVIEVLNSIGYTSCWFSNQPQYGLMDNICSSFSAICDYSFFTEYSGPRLDQEVISLYDNFKNTHSIARELNFYVFHLYGQHPSFSSRYPDSFTQFSEGLYEDFPERHRHILAQYDNATYYNDYVVTEIISRFEKEESVVIYLSDHGFDLFYKDDFSGHGRPADPISDKYGRDIPFMIYLSHTYQEMHPEWVKKIANNTNNSFNTECLM